MQAEAPEAAAEDPGEAYKPPGIGRRLFAVFGLGAFTLLCFVSLIALVAVAALLGVLLLEALID